MPVAPDIVTAVSQRLAEHAGLELPAWVVAARVAVRIAARELAADDYVALIQSPRGGPELDELIEAVRVGESRLFRHRSQIGALIDSVVPALRASGRRAIRAWSAGCASGEEPYTLAAVLARRLPGCSISIVATDVSADALAVARERSYPASALADVPPEWRDGFVVEGDRLVVRSELASLVRFERANIVDGFAPRHCDLVWCRNVLIYFTAPARKRAIERLVAATNPGGCVFVGYSESLREVDELEPVRAGDAVYYVRRDGEPFAARTATPPAGAAIAPGGSRTPPTGVPASRPTTDRTPPPIRIPTLPPAEDVLVLRGHPDPRTLTAELATRLAIAGMRRLAVELDRVELLTDDLAPVFRRARAAARAAGATLELRATRTGARRWLARHGLDEDSER